MLLLALTGPAKAGKNEVANHLVNRFRFVRCAFSDALYDEVQAAYGLDDQSLLRDQLLKDEPQDRLMLKWLRNGVAEQDFEKIVTELLDKQCNANGTSAYLYPRGVALSPREVLQWWGTEFRRAQDADYWVRRLSDRIGRIHFAPKYSEHRPRFFVVDGMRFENERAFINKMKGSVWHIWRETMTAPTTGHVSETLLPVRDGERHLYNNHTIEALQAGVELLLGTTSWFARQDPPVRMTEPHECDYSIPVKVVDTVVAMRCAICGADQYTAELAEPVVE